MPNNTITPEMWSSPPTVAFRDYIQKRAKYLFFTAIANPANFPSKSSNDTSASQIKGRSNRPAPLNTASSSRVVPPSPAPVFASSIGIYSAGGDHARLPHEDGLLTIYTAGVFEHLEELFRGPKPHASHKLSALVLDDVAAKNEKVERDDLVLHIRLLRDVLYFRGASSATRLKLSAQLRSSSASGIDADSTPGPRTRSRVASARASPKPTGGATVGESEVPSLSSLVQLTTSLKAEFDRIYAIVASFDTPKDALARIQFRRMYSAIKSDFDFAITSAPRAHHVRMDTFLAVSCIYQAIVEMHEGGSMEVPPLGGKAAKTGKTWKSFWENGLPSATWSIPGSAFIFGQGTSTGPKTGKSTLLDGAGGSVAAAPPGAFTGSNTPGGGYAGVVSRSAAQWTDPTAMVAALWSANPHARPPLSPHSVPVPILRPSPYPAGGDRWFPIGESAGDDNVPTAAATAAAAENVNAASGNQRNIPGSNRTLSSLSMSISSSSSGSTIFNTPPQSPIRAESGKDRKLKAALYKTWKIWRALVRWALILALVFYLFHYLFTNSVFRFIDFSAVMKEAKKSYESAASSSAGAVPGGNNPMHGSFWNMFLAPFGGGILGQGGQQRVHTQGQGQGYGQRHGHSQGYYQRHARTHDWDRRWY